jgi:hypothetical protein
MVFPYSSILIYGYLGTLLRTIVPLDIMCTIDHEACYILWPHPEMLDLLAQITHAWSIYKLTASIMGWPDPNIVICEATEP